MTSYSSFNDDEDDEDGMNNNLNNVKNYVIIGDNGKILDSEKNSSKSFDGVCRNSICAVSCMARSRAKIIK